MSPELIHDRALCCQHAANCAVHAEPFDAQYVACDCFVGMGSIRHAYSIRGADSQPRAVQVDDQPRL